MHEPQPPEKMYVLVRNDLPTGYQMAQAIHAAVEFSLKHPALTKATPTVVVLSVSDEVELLAWADRLAGWCSEPAAIDRQFEVFEEPDLIGCPGGAFTSLATVYDGTEFSALPLAGRRPTS